MLKAIVLDFDGVILESLDIKGRAFAHLFKDHPDDLDEIVKFHHDNGGMSRFEKFRIIHEEILHRPLSDSESQELGKRFSEFVLQEILDCSFVDGAREFLDRACKDFSLFVASATPQEEIRFIVKSRGLAKYFVDVFGTPVPKSRIISQILETNGYRSSEVLFVGDTLADYEAARETGVGFVGRVPAGKPNPFEDTGVDVITDLFGLERYVPERTQAIRTDNAT